MSQAMSDDALAASSSRSHWPLLPPEDRALLAGLQPHEVRAAADSKIQTYRAEIEKHNAYISQLMTIQNTTVPLHATLPPEVLMNVFRHVFPTRASDIFLTRVCKLWRDLVYRTPEFWADVVAVPAFTARLDDQTLTTYLARSSPLLCEVDVHKQLAALKTTPSHVMRVHSLSFQLPLGSGYVPHLTALLDLDMPLLETLTCRSYFADTGTLVLNQSSWRNRPTSDVFPRLRTLSLHGTGLASPAFAFSSLTKINIHDGVDGLGDPPDDLYQLLEGCPQLQVLNLNTSTCFWGLQDRDSASRARVFLPCLRAFSLVLRMPSGMWANNFLKQVCVPALERMRITWAMGSTVSLSILIPSGPPSSIGVEVLHTIHTLQFCCRERPDDEIVLHANGFVSGDPEPRLTLNIHDPHSSLELDSSGAIRALAKIFCHAASLTSFELLLHDRVTVRPHEWCSILDELPWLSSLTVRINSCRDLLTTLRRHPTRWSGLRRLSIWCHNGSGVHESLLTAVERRARAGLHPLEYLAFCGNPETPLSVHRMRRLQDHVREVSTTVDVQLGL